MSTLALYEENEALWSLLFVAANFYMNVRENQKVSDAISRVDTVVNASYHWLDGANQRNFCGGTSDSGACTDTNRIALQQLIDLKLIKTESTQNPFSTKSLQISIAPAQINHSYITLTYQDVPVKACAKLEQKLKDKVKVINNVPQISCQDVAGVATWSGTF